MDGWIYTQGYRQIHMHIDTMIQDCLQIKERELGRNLTHWHLGLNFCRTQRKGVSHVNLSCARAESFMKNRASLLTVLERGKPKVQGVTFSTYLMADNRQAGKTENGAHLFLRNILPRHPAPRMTALLH